MKHGAWIATSLLILGWTHTAQAATRSFRCSLPNPELKIEVDLSEIPGLDLTRYEFRRLSASGQISERSTGVAEHHETFAGSMLSRDEYIFVSNGGHYGLTFTSATPISRARVLLSAPDSLPEFDCESL